MKADLEKSFPNAEVILTAGERGIYDIWLNDRQEIFSKLTKNRFPEDSAEVIKLLKKAELSS